MLRYDLGRLNRTRSATVAAYWYAAVLVWQRVGPPLARRTTAVWLGLVAWCQTAPQSQGVLAWMDGGAHKLASFLVHQPRTP